MKGRAPRRSILHVDLDPFFISVERSQDPALRGRPLVVGGDPASLTGVVAAVSEEARQAGVRPGQPLAQARRLCPEAELRAGDLEAYARFSNDVTAVLLTASRRVERPSADEAFLDLGPEADPDRSAVALAETVKDELQRRLGLDASFGLAGSRLAARVASRWARPRGLLVVLPGYEPSLLAQEPVTAVSDLPPGVLAALQRASLATLGDVAGAELSRLETLVGPGAARRLLDAARGEDHEPIPVAAPPTWVQEEATVRTPEPDRALLEGLLGGLLERGLRRVRPFGLAPRSLLLEVERREGSQRRSIELADDDATRLDAATLAAVAATLLEPARGVRTLRLRLSRLERPVPQVPLFPVRRLG